MTPAALRSWIPSERTERLVYLGVVLAQCGIVVTGGLVRLTGSGLGCPTWPRCDGDSLTPVAENGAHGAVEFGNRLLTFVVLVAVVASIVVAVRRRPRRQPLVLLAWAGVLGVLGQAVLGGMTVLTGLNPLLVAAHFLLSAVLIGVAVALHQRQRDAGDARPEPLVRDEVRWLAWALVALGGVVLVLGTLVTGSGPHAGDVDTPRLGLDPRTMAWIHADAVIAFLGVTLALLLALRLTDSTRAAQRRTLAVLVASLAQGALGYLQYFTGVPAVLVAFHLAGACLVWVAALRVPYVLRTRAAALAPSGELGEHGVDEPVHGTG